MVERQSQPSEVVWFWGERKEGLIEHNPPVTHPLFSPLIRSAPCTPPPHAWKSSPTTTSRSHMSSPSRSTMHQQAQHHPLAKSQSGWARPARNPLRNAPRRGTPQHCTGGVAANFRPPVSDAAHPLARGPGLCRANARRADPRLQGVGVVCGDHQHTTIVTVMLQRGRRGVVADVVRRQHACVLPISEQQQPPLHTTPLHKTDWRISRSLPQLTCQRTKIT